MGKIFRTGMFTKRLGSMSLFICVILVVWAAVIFSAGVNPLLGFGYIFKGALVGKTNFFSTLDLMVPIMLLALAVAIPGWTGIWNIGGEGQFLLGALSAAYVGLNLELGNPLLNILAAIIAAMTVGALWSFWAGYLKVKLQINEIVTTLMANYIATLLVSYLINYPLKEPKSSWAQTADIGRTFQIHHLVGGSQFSATFFISLGIVLIFLFLQRKTRLGYELTMIGSNERLAYFGGIAVGPKRMIAMSLGGAVAGISGGLVVLGNTYRMKEGISPGYGFTGLLVCLLADNNPIAIVLVAFLFAVLQVGSLNLQLFSDAPVEIGGVLQVVLILFVAAFRIILRGRKHLR
jgi:simple sugar transport system permease protein